MYLNQLSFCLKKLLKVLGGTIKSLPNDNPSKEAIPKLYTVREFENIAELDTINIFDLLSFMKNSKLVHKLRGYVEKYENGVSINIVSKKPTGVKAFLNTLQQKNVEEIDNKPIEKSEEEQGNSPLLFVYGFFECLLSKSSDGRIFVIPGSTIGQGTLKFLLLNPAAHFHDIGKF